MDSQWPPRSPHEALLSTPGGRDRLRRLANSKSPTPSPAKLRIGSALPSRSRSAGPAADEDNELDDDDDEETLQLKLQAIQARLKLKKLQATRARQVAGEADTENNAPRPESAPGGVKGRREIPMQARLAAARDRVERAASQNAVQVPASPVKRAQSTTGLQRSPQRIVLGIDKGLKAADVSLKRAPLAKREPEGRTSQQGGYLRRSKTPLPGQVQAEVPRPLSFNERLAAARTEELDREERQARIQRLRTKAFEVGRQEMEGYKSKAVDVPDIPLKEEEFTRDEILASTGHPNGGLQRSNTMPSIRTAYEAGAADPAERRSFTPSERSAAPETGRTPRTKAKVAPPDVSDADAAQFEPYSGLHLSKRILPHKVLARAITGKKTYKIQDLLKHVKAPDWSLPDVESDIVVFAILARKTDPRSHRPAPGAQGRQQQDRGKYMVMTIVDLKYEIELYLFNSGFDRFWKLTPGTVLAILNPIIMPPAKGLEATGRFGLVINSDADTMLEVGSARDLGFCKSVKKDGHLCNSWVNAKRTEHCEFHTNEAVRRARGDRMELNVAGFGGGPRRRHNSHYLHTQSQAQKDKEAHKEKHFGTFDWESRAHVFISGGGGGAQRGGAALDEDREGGMADRAQREEALKRRNTAKERERDIARRLGELGRGAGRDYLARSATDSAALGSSVSSADAGTASPEPPKKADAVSLGVIPARGGERPKIDLGPAKRKRSESAQSNSTAGGGSVGAARKAMGWGTVLGNKLTRMKEGEKLDGSRGITEAGTLDIASAFARGDRSPVRKKTRFVTEKGIREAGRESLGEPLSAAAAGGNQRRQVVLADEDDDDDDDDDDLIIVK